jgi:flagellar hook-basal body complex protein FliE
MQVLPVNQLSLPLQPPGAGTPQEAGVGSFAGVLNRALQELNYSQVKAEQLTSELVTGEIQDIHQVTVAMTEARLTMQLAIEVRNKVIEAYQEVSRMQI